MAAGLGFIVIAGAAAAITLIGGGQDSGTRDRRRVNVVVVMTDDQTLESMRVMARTRALLGGEGTTFSRSYASYPLCCPSRATFLTGQYAHNHGVRDNLPPAGGFYKLDSNETLPVWLQRAGYRTMHVGKYLNRYGKDAPPTVPPGWDEWFGLVDPTTYQYYGYEISDNGRKVRFGDSPADYQTDALADRAVQLIIDATERDQPFFLSFATLAPHVRGQLGETIGTAVPADRHRGNFVAEPLPRPPSFDEADVADKPEAIRELEPLDDDETRALESSYRSALESLLAVDEAVGRIVDTLDRRGVLDETLVIFTSDNGYFYGEHRVRAQKTLLYEPSSRVPLIIRGPGFPKGETVDAPVVNVDLAPTILAATGAKPALPLDGRDLRPITRDPKSAADRGILLDNRNDGPRPQSTAIVTSRWFFADHSTGEAELYDLSNDPDQLDNLADDPDHGVVRLELFGRLDRLRDCVADACE